MRSGSKDGRTVIVIGGGAAGLMAAGTAAQEGARVILLERNEKVGRKLGITGKGRCNVTSNSDPKRVIENVTKNGRFLYSAVNAFPPSAVMAFFEGLGVPLKTERGDRVFPVSDRAADIVNALRTFLRRGGAETVRARAESLIIENGKLRGVKTDRGEFRGDAVIVCTGGLGYPLTGSTGDGYALARQAGHTVEKPLASLVPLETAGEDAQRMQGFSLRNVGVRILDKKGKTVYEDFGELMFTHFGVTGPVILSASAHLRDFEKNRYRLIIDLKPALDEKKLDARILRDFEKYRNREFANALSDLEGRSMIPVLVERSGIDPEKRVNAVTKEERRRLVELFKGFELELTGPRPIEEAIVTSGGVSVRQVDPKTMESKLLPGLYFAGEVLDVDAYTGGFNLQIAWSTGRAAGRAAAEGKEKPMKHINVAIDGPSGAGKSTVAKLVSRELGIVYVDTGAMYRCVGLHTIRAGLEADDAEGIEKLLPDLKIGMEYVDGTQRMFINGEDVTDLIRTPEVTRYASAVSAIPAVRAFLLDTQRNLARENSVIMDGRDIGTVVLPGAEVKIFLTASPEVRAQRRLLDFQAKNIDITFEEVLRDIKARDLADSTREIAPLKPAEDSIIVDCSYMTLDESVAAVKGIILKKL